MSFEFSLMLLRILLAFFIAVSVGMPHDVGDQRLFDDAQAIESFTQVAIHGLLSNLEEQTGVEFVVVTRSGLADADLESEATDLFASLGLGRRAYLNAVLMLIDSDGKRVEVVTGYGMERLLTRQYLQAVIDEFMVYPLKSGDIGKSVFEGVEQIAKLLTRYPLAAQGRGEGLPLAVSTPRLRAVLFAGFVTPFFVLGMLVAWWIYYRRFYPPVVFYSLGITTLFFCSTFLGYFLEVNPGGQPWVVAIQVSLLLASLAFLHWFLFKRYGPHSCLACGGRLELLSDAKDAELIWETSFLEYMVSGRSKDVWFCSNCLRRKTERYVNSYLELTECPNCRAPALRETRRPIKAPSPTATGLDRVEAACISCRYSYVSNEIVPRVARKIQGASRGQPSDVGAS